MLARPPPSFETRPPLVGRANSRREIFAGGLIPRIAGAKGTFAGKPGIPNARRRPSTLSRTRARPVGSAFQRNGAAACFRPSEIARPALERSAPDSALTARDKSRICRSQRPPASPIGPVPCRLSGLASIIEVFRPLRDSKPLLEPSLSIRRRGSNPVSKELSSFGSALPAGSRQRYSPACAMFAVARATRTLARAISVSRSRFLCTCSTSDGPFVAVGLIVPFWLAICRVPWLLYWARAALRSNGRR